MTRTAVWRQDRGAILVHVAVSLLALTAFSAIVVDYGVFWVSRAQAQNAADAGALAGAVSLAFDDYSDRGDGGPAKQAAVTLATTTKVWSDAAAVTAADVTFPDSTDLCPQSGVGDDPRNYGGQPPCVRVDVHQVLPTYFAQLLGIYSQEVRATAMARFVSGNVTDCVSPLAVPDKWTEVNFVPGYQKYQSAGALLPLAAEDSYSAPTPDVPGGYRFDQNLDNGGHFGAPLTLQEAPATYPAIQAGQFIAIDLPRATASPTGDVFQANVESCSGSNFNVGAAVDPLPPPTISSAVAGAATRIAADPAAVWTNGRIQNSCAQDTPPCAAFSPRLMALPVFDVSEYDRTRWPGMTLNVRIVNVIGFFIESVTATSIAGRVAYFPGLTNPSAPGIAYPSTFLRSAMLMR